jgi:RNA recognition motif-containing protein
MFVFPVNVHMPKDRVTQMHQGYGFVEFMGEEDADYAIKIMNMIKLYGKPIRVNKVCSTSSFSSRLCMLHAVDSPITGRYHCPALTCNNILC